MTGDLVGAWSDPVENPLTTPGTPPGLESAPYFWFRCTHVDPETGERCSRKSTDNTDVAVWSDETTARGDAEDDGWVFDREHTVCWEHADKIPCFHCRGRAGSRSCTCTPEVTG